MASRGLWLCCTYAAAAHLSSLSFSCYAQLGQNLALGNAKAIALGNAVTADPPGLDAIHFNPAGLTRLRGKQVTLKLLTGKSVVSGTVRKQPDYIRQLEALDLEDPMPGTTTTEGGVRMLPGTGMQDASLSKAVSGGMSYSPPDSRLTFANALYTPLAVGIARKESDPASVASIRRALMRVTYFSPSVGFKFSDTLSFGGSIGFSYMGTGHEFNVRYPSVWLSGLHQYQQQQCGGAEELGLNLCGGRISPVSSLFRIHYELEDNISPSFNLGVLWQPVEWFSWGAVYQSAAENELRGHFRVDVDRQLVALLDGVSGSFDPDALALLHSLGFPEDYNGATTKASLELDYPQHVATGISVIVLPGWKLNIDLKWTETEIWDEMELEFSDTIEIFEALEVVVPGVTGDSVTISVGYESTLSWAFGLEYQYSDSLALRFGYEPRPSAVPEENRDLSLPLADLDLFGLGLEYHFSADTKVDLALFHIRSDNRISKDVNLLEPAMDNYELYDLPGYDIDSKFRATFFELNIVHRL